MEVRRDAQAKGGPGQSWIRLCSKSCRRSNLRERKSPASGHVFKDSDEVGS